MLKTLLIHFLSLISILDLPAQRGKHILVYTKNGVGFVHDNIPNAIHCLDSLSHLLKVKITNTVDPRIFNDTDLQKIDLIVFASTNNDVFDTDDQRLAFRHYIEAGGSFFGIHSAVGTERKWTWFKQMMGGLFSWHPRFQNFEVIKTNPNHTTVSDISPRWTRKDECYFLKEWYPGIQTILSIDLNSLHPDSSDQQKIVVQKGGFDRYYPISWEQKFDGGHILISTLGHHKNDYHDPVFTSYLKSCIRYQLKNKVKKNYKLIHSVTKDDLPHNLK